MANKWKQKDRLKIATKAATKLAFCNGMIAENQGDEVVEFRFFVNKVCYFYFWFLMENVPQGKADLKV